MRRQRSLLLLLVFASACPPSPSHVSSVGVGGSATVPAPEPAAEPAADAVDASLDLAVAVDVDVDVDVDMAVAVDVDVDVGVGDVGSPDLLLAFDAPWDWRRPSSDPGPDWALDLGADRPATDGWASGPAPFRGVVPQPEQVVDEEGAGTTIVLPPSAFSLQPSAFSPRPAVWLFATTFDVPEPSTVVAALAEVHFAGGCIVWLNGREWFRSNVDPARGAFADPADVVETPTHVRQAQGGIWRRTFAGLDPTSFRATGNILAVEVHRAPDDVDVPLFFDLRLSAHRSFGFVKTPYLQDPRSDGATVSWETSAPSLGTVRFGEGECFDRSAGDAGACATHHEVRVDGLSPGVEVPYGIESLPCGFASAPPPPASSLRPPTSPPFWNRVGTLRAAPAAGEPFSFLAYGDSRSNPKAHARVVEGMMSVAVDARPAFVINTGDLTDHGNSDVEWNEQFFAPAAPLLASVPIVPVFGNHDHQDESWYSWFALPGNEAWFSFTAGDAELFALDNYTGLGSRSEQGAWLEGALAASTARWKIVIMHQPLRSCLGDRERRRAAQRLRELLEPTFVEHHVRLVLAGHDHLYGRSKEEQGLTLVTTGGGGAGLYPVRQSDDHAVCASEWNFVLVDVSAASLRVRAFRPDGELLDEFEILQEQETTAEHR